MVFRKNIFMRYKLLQLLIFILILSSCCNEDSIETARYELFDSELQLIPYQLNQKIGFKHSKGYTFSFNTTMDKLEWKEHHDFCEWNCCGQDYFSYQEKNTQIQSDYPRFTINFSLIGAQNGNYNHNSLQISINHTYFTNLPYDSLGNFICNETTGIIYHDSILLNNKYYYDVFEKALESNISKEDTDILVPKSILYNDYGLIQIKTSNDETYSINQ